jgi:glycosyltransferase involved in cell wall biosynthesis
LRIARGVQNKVLEAMAMAKPVVASIQALEGITAHIGEEALLAWGRSEFIATVSTLLQYPRNDIGRAARARVLANYTWERNLERVDELLSPAPGVSLRSTAAAAKPIALKTAGVMHE